MSGQRRGNELARRSQNALSRRGGARPRVVYTHTEHDRQYTVTESWFGELTLNWNANWLSGLFCITDFPTEWVAYVQAAFRGGWREGVHDLGADRPFSAVTWDLSDWERAVGPFSPANAGHWLPSDPVWGMVEAQAAVPPKRGDIPWIRSLTLPDPGETTI